MYSVFFRRIVPTFAILGAHGRAALVLVCLASVACGAQRYPRDPNDPNAVASRDRGETRVAPSPQSVTLVGRFQKLSAAKSVRFAWPNSAMGFNFDGDAIGIVLAEDAVRTVGPSIVHNMYEVVVDGEVMPPITVTSTTPQTFPIAQGLLPGPHTAWVIKRTEGMIGSGVFMGLDVPEQTQLLPPPPPRERRIEVYGASNEAGYGNLGKATRQNMCNYSTATQNAAVAYPARVANALQADLVNISFSGKGMVGTCTPGDNAPLPDVADRTDPLYPHLWHQDPAQAPQVVLVTLGANDFAAGPPNKTVFQAKYNAFLRKLRRRYPNAAIICTITPMMAGADRVHYGQWLQQIVARADDKHVSMLEFPTYTGNTFGCDSHPDEALHEVLAQRLQAAVTRATGWR